MKKIIIVSLIVLTFMLPALVFATEGDNSLGGQNQPKSDSQEVKLDNKLNVDTPQELIGVIIDSILGVVGSLALLMFVFGGITWMTSSGSPEKVKKGRDIIVWAAVGLMIVFSAYGLTRVLLEGVMK